MVGSLTVNGVWECYTLERFDMIIPTGTYEIELYNSPKHGKNTPQLKNVPGRSNIQIHVANFADELLGCIAPGTEHGKDYVSHSKVACDKLSLQIVAAITQKEPVSITVA